jgi:hypothetical protein
MQNVESVIPRQYALSHVNEDTGESGLKFDNDSSRLISLQNGEFNDVLANYNNMNAIIDRQRYNFPQYDFHSPGYYLLNNNVYSEEGMPYEKAMEMIQKSKLKDLYNQHNFHVIWSPHTHVGKSRGYMNWKKSN